MVSRTLPNEVPSFGKLWNFEQNTAKGCRQRGAPKEGKREGRSEWKFLQELLPKVGKAGVEVAGWFAPGSPLCRTGRTQQRAAAVLLLFPRSFYEERRALSSRSSKCRAWTNTTMTCPQAALFLGAFVASFCSALSALPRLSDSFKCVRNTLFQIRPGSFLSRLPGKSGVTGECCQVFWARFQLCVSEAEIATDKV